MEEVLLNIDSKYRNILINPNEAKFRYNLEKMYKNIISARMISIEINNNISYIDSFKGNNYITIHLPNKLNDPEGTKLELEDGLYQVIGLIQNSFNGLFEDLFNTNGGLQRRYIDNKNFAEKYFYFFYLNDDVEFNFDFNSILLPLSLSNKLTIKKGWHSIYGLVIQISDYITDKYNERQIYKLANPLTPIIDLDNGNFAISSLITLPIFDRRFRSVLTGDPTIHDCIRYDNIATQTFNGGNLNSNLSLLKTYIYQIYIIDITTFIPQNITTYSSYVSHGILDDLYSGEYIIPSDPIATSFGNLSPNYIFNSTKLLSRSIYYLTKTFGEIPGYPTSCSTQIYNLIMQHDLLSLKVSINNFFTKALLKSSCECLNDGFFYYYVSPTSINQTWYTVDKTPLNRFDTLFCNKQYLRDEMFITQAQLDDPLFQYTTEKDIADFEIDFSTYKLESAVTNGLIDIKRLNYPPVGYYLGFRPDLSKTSDNFIFSGIIDNTERIIKGTKIFDITGDDYLFLKVNDWGYFDFFSQKMFAKIILTSGLDSPKIEDYVNKEFRFRQPININKLDIELVDYLGNTVQLGGFNWSFTLELKQIVNSSDKTDIERKTLVFNNVYN